MNEKSFGKDYSFQTNFLIKNEGENIMANENINATEELSQFNQEDQENEVSRYIIFELNKELLGIELTNVQEVLTLDYIQKIPKISEKFAGIYNLRGEVLLILDLAQGLFPGRINLVKQGELSRKVIVLKISQDVIGILVDNINDIIELTDDNFENIPALIQTKIPIEFIERIAQAKDRIIKILNIKQIISENLIFPSKLDNTKKKGSDPKSRFGEDRTKFWIIKKTSTKQTP